MVKLEEIARAILSGDALGARSLVQDWLALKPAVRDTRKPETCDEKLLAVAASIVELFAARSGEAPPEWTQSVAPLAEYRAPAAVAAAD